MGDIQDDGKGRYAPVMPDLPDHYTPPRQAVANGIAALEEDERRAMRKISPTPGSERWEKEFGWVCGWEERLDRETLDMADPEHNIRVQLWGDWRRRFFRVRTANMVTEYPMWHGFVVSRDKYDGYGWTAEEAVHHGYPEGLPEEDDGWGGKLVPPAILEEEYAKAQAELTQAWKDALLARKSL